MLTKSIFNTKYKSAVIDIGGVLLGGEQPIRLQSMTSTNTLLTQATTNQSIRMIEAGCELVRITTPSLNEVKSLKRIQTELRAKGFDNPLIADIHYQPKAAEEAAKHIAKVRINPGNYVDRKNPEKAKYLQTSYSTDLEKIASNLFPLIEICKKHHTVIRIGTNHGSLSERILSRYGNTPKGMVESAMEFVHICRKFDFHNIVLSMKSSNIKVMVHAYRMLVDRLITEGFDYPIHLGVTEAGNGIEGRIKSAIGIGTLLKEGIGDTIRVSLTEDPEKELPAAKKIVEIATECKNNLFFKSINPFEYNPRVSKAHQNIGGDQVAVVVSSTKNEQADYHFNQSTSNLVSDESTIELADHDNKGAFYVPFKNSTQAFDIIKDVKNASVIILQINDGSSLYEVKKCFASCIDYGIQLPIIIKLVQENLSDEDFIYKSSIDLGSLLIDGLVDGLWIDSKDSVDGTDLAFKILQLSGVRITQTEFIACPSCGRTLYNIQDAFEKVKAATGHLKGLKIAVMGCVVNGPGEMADANYGYVGAGKGKVNLYKSRDLVKKGVEENQAIEALIDLIKENGDWQNP